jgi:hypothetical protein
MVGLGMAGPLTPKQAESMNADNEYWEHLMPRLRKRPLAMLGHLSGTKVGTPWSEGSLPWGLSPRAMGFYDPRTRETRVRGDKFFNSKDIFQTSSYGGGSMYDDIQMHELEHAGHDHLRSPIDKLMVVFEDMLTSPWTNEHDRIGVFEVNDEDASADHLTSSYWSTMRPDDDPWTTESVDAVKQDRGEWETRAMDEIAKLLKLRE